MRAVLFKTSWSFFNPSNNHNNINHGLMGESLSLTQSQLNANVHHDHDTRPTPIHDTLLTTLTHYLCRLYLLSSTTCQQNGPGLSSVQYNYDNSDKNIAPPNTDAFTSLPTTANLHPLSAHLPLILHNISTALLPRPQRSYSLTHHVNTMTRQSTKYNTTPLPATSI